MSYIAVHEILYRDELDGKTARVEPGAELSKAQEKALSKDIPALLKNKAIKEEKSAPASSSKSGKLDDGFVG